MKKLERSVTDRKIAGVAGGLGEYFGIDPVIFRVIFVILLLPGGFSALPYFVLWIVMPNAKSISDRNREAIDV
ncbi:MAG: PspC protein [Candidatus Saccharibacteria bacterium]|nr:PspC protein [Candidatus Saccharibacteria bacterium]